MLLSGTLYRRWSGRQSATVVVMVEEMLKVAQGNGERHPWSLPPESTGVGTRGGIKADIGKGSGRGRAHRGCWCMTFSQVNQAPGPVVRMGLA